MADTIENYGDLKAAVQRYLIRSNPELVDEIPTFIQFAERKIFRELRTPANEAVQSWPEGTPGIDDYSSRTLPIDYLEAKFITFGGIPLERISDTRYFALRASNDNASGQPVAFCRVGRSLRFWPTPDNPSAIDMVYFKDFSGELVEDTDTTDFLRLIPDMYIYGACLEAAPWLQNDQRISTWAALWKQSLDAVNWQRDEAEYSGSNVVVSSVGNGGYYVGGPN